MNKTKQELYDENKKLKEELENYKNFWEGDALKEQNKEISIYKKVIIGTGIVSIWILAFLLGMMLK